MDKKKKNAIIALIAAVISVTCLAAAFGYLWIQKRNYSIYEKLQSEVVNTQEEPSEPSKDEEGTDSPALVTVEKETEETSAEETSEEETSEEETTEEETTSEPYVSPINFDELTAINADVYAWIDIPGTEISYPILQHPTEDNYYLYYTIENAYGYPGALYTFCGMAKDFSRFNTVIYGHDMKNGSMFGTLKYFRDPSYLQEHRTIYIYTPEAAYTYTIFAAVIYDDRLITSYYDDDNPEDSAAFLASLNETRNLNNIIMDDIEVTAEDHIITLSTCTFDVDNSRLLVLAVRTDEEN